MSSVRKIHDRMKDEKPEKNNLPKLLEESEGVRAGFAFRHIPSVSTSLDALKDHPECKEHHVRLKRYPAVVVPRLSSRVCQLPFLQSSTPREVSSVEPEAKSKIALK